MHWGKALDRLRRTWGGSGIPLVSMCLEKSNRRRCLLDSSGSETCETWSARCSRRPRTSSFIGVLLLFLGILLHRIFSACASRLVISQIFYFSSSFFKECYLNIEACQKHKSCTAFYCAFFGTFFSQLDWKWNCVEYLLLSRVFKWDLVDRGTTKEFGHYQIFSNPVYSSSPSVLI